MSDRLAIHEKDTEQTHVCLAFPTVPLTHPDRYAVDLLSTILGHESPSQRLARARITRLRAASPTRATAPLL